MGHTLMLDAYSSAVAEWTHLLWLERVEDYSSIHGGGLQALPDWVGEPHLHCANPAGLKKQIRTRVRKNSKTTRLFNSILSKHWINIFSNFSCMFLNPNNFSNLNSNCSNLLDLRNLQEQAKKHFVTKNCSDLSLSV